MQVIHAPNQLSLQTDFIALIGEDDRLSPHEIIAQNALRFSGPVLCQVNEGFWLRADWDARLPAGATVRFIVVPQGDIGRILASIAVVALSMYAPYALGIAGTLGGTLLSAAIAIGGMLLIGMLFPVAKPGDMGTPDTMYSLSNSNRMRPGEPYAERFGRTPFYPDVACSYTDIVNNEQYLHALLILGIGYFSDVSVYVDRTPLLDYSGATWSIIPPGEDPDFYVAWTSAEAGGQELSTAWITYVVNPRGTSATTIKYDVIFSGGLIGYNDEGDAYSVSVPVTAEARRIDAYGNALGDWILHDSYTFRAASKDPLRFSRGCAVPAGAGRYEFRVRRTSSPSESSRVVDRCSLGGLRAFGCLQPTLDDVTLLRVTIKATNQLNSDVASKIQVHATRNLHPVTSTGFGVTRAASRSIVDMVAYAVTSDNGGQLSDSILIWDVLAELRADLIAAGWNFDWGWISRVSVMEACSTAAACALAIMYTPGGKVCLAQDTLQVSYGVPFTDDDFDPGSLEITTTFRTAASPTCIRIKYYDWNSGQEETLDCYDADGSDFNPKEIALNGCTDRQHAYEVGMRLYRTMMRSTVAVGWATGLKGNLPTMFQWVPIASTAANILASGIIAAVEPGKIWLSEPVDFGGEATGWLRLATPAGGHAGPYAVTPTEYTHCVNGSISGLKTLKADGPNEAQRYIFGTDVKTVRLVKIMAIRPQGQNSIALMGQVVDESVYTDPVGTAPEMGSTEECLTSMCLSLTENPDVTNGYRAYWAFAATQFKVEVSVDSGEYELLADHYAGTSIPFVREVALIVTVRVTPYLAGVLHTEAALTASIEYAPVPALSVTVDTDSADATWTAVENADSYTVQLWEGDTLRGQRQVSATSTSITADQIVAMGGPPWVSFEIRVAAKIGDQQSAFDSEAVTVPALAAPGNFICEQTNASSVLLTWSRVSHATGYRVYMSETQGFDPATEGELVAVVSATGAIVSLDLTEPYAYYFRVCATNDWYRRRGYWEWSDELEVSAGWSTTSWLMRGVDYVSADSFGAQAWFPSTTAQWIDNVANSTFETLNFVPSYITGSVGSDVTEPRIFIISGRGAPVLDNDGLVKIMMLRITEGSLDVSPPESSRRIKIDLVAVDPDTGTVQELSVQNDLTAFFSDLMVYVPGYWTTSYGGPVWVPESWNNGFVALMSWWDDLEPTGTTTIDQGAFLNMRPVIDMVNGKIFFDLQLNSRRWEEPYNESTLIDGEGLYSFSFSTVEGHDNRIDFSSISNVDQVINDLITCAAISSDPLSVSDGGNRGVVFAGRSALNGLPTETTLYVRLLRVSVPGYSCSTVCDFSASVADFGGILDVCFDKDGGLWVLVGSSDWSAGTLTVAAYHFDVETVRLSSFSTAAADHIAVIPSFSGMNSLRPSMAYDFEQDRLLVSVCATTNGLAVPPYSELRLYSVVKIEGEYASAVLVNSKNVSGEGLPTVTRWLNWGITCHNSKG